jgi:type 1 glutamine amidotransferase
MKRISVIISVAVLLLLLSTSCEKKTAYKALIITGQNSVSSTNLKAILGETGLFSASIKKSPVKGSDMSSFSPDFAKYNLIVIDYNGDEWSEKTKNAFIDYVKNGGGVVICQSAGNAFPGWKEYGEMCGVTTGQAGVPDSVKEFEVRIRNSENPVTKGLPVRWIHARDLLYSHLSGPGMNTEVLATAYCDTTGGGSGKDEPVLLAVTYGKGRVFHTTLGFAENKDDPAMKCSGFITTFQRGAEWAATGNVTQPVPADFPNTAGVVVRQDLKPLTLKEDFDGIVNYKIDRSTRYLTEIGAAVRNAQGNPQELLNIEKMMVDVLKNSNATVESKKLMLHELSWMGSDYCVPAVKELASDPDMKDAAEFALERLKIK